MRVINHLGHTYGGFSSMLLEPGYDSDPLCGLVVIRGMSNAVVSKLWGVCRT
jgi:hypothetical protein